jgi:hypothetical protein
MAPSDIKLLPDAGPLITLAYADALDVLFKPGWQVALVDMVQLEVTRKLTPTSEKIQRWLQQHQIAVLPTQTLVRYRQNLEPPSSHPQSGIAAAKKSNLGELALQETINQFALQTPPQSAVLLFEDHRIARSSFYLPPHCQRVSTRAFLIFLEQKGAIESASAIERRALQAGRMFSQLRYPPPPPPTL